MRPNQHTTEVAVSSSQFCALLYKHGFDFCAGVPCSIFKGIIKQMEQQPAEYLPAVREDTAVGIAVGAFLAGKQPLVLMQNSGLGVCLNALTSLAIIYRIPLLLLISWRGYQGQDAPEHLVMGEAMLGILEQVGIGYEVLHAADITGALDRAVTELDSKRLPYALIFREGILN
ncbi:sulfopyruvate decarboxylase subunit alpha [bacterium]|nr:sulfopyruvate decarboxylase subunit alpha [bacterium]